MVSLTFDLHGAVVDLRAFDDTALATLQRAVPPGARSCAVTDPDATFTLVVERADAGATTRTHALYEDSRRIARGTSVASMLAALENAVQFRVAVCARTRLFVHAGVVGWRGGAIVIPGRTYSGKSTLVAALVRAGATYYSDEYAVLDDAGRVHPFARPLGIRDTSGRTRAVAPESLGAIVGEQPQRVKLVVATHHDAGATWAPRSMSSGETLLALMDNTVAVRHRPADALRTLAATLEGARGIRGARGEADDVAQRILAHRSLQEDDA